MTTNTNLCPRCGAATMKRWDELDRDEKIVVERLPRSTEFDPEERKKHRFCTRCLFESTEIEKKA